MTHPFDLLSPDAPPAPRQSAMGLSADSFQSIRFSTPSRLFDAERLLRLAAHLGAAGAHGGMTSIDLDWARRTRALKERLGLYLEIQTFLPRAGESPDVFEHAVKVAREAGASSLRVVCLLGRRYEMFESLDAWQAAVQEFHRQIQVAVPIVERHRMRLGIENHKDWRVDEQVALLQRYSSEFIGVTLDTGNNLSVLDDPIETVEKLAPYTFNVHFKDMAMEEVDTGFLLSEVPLGEGVLDLKRMVSVIRAARPEVHFSLEMITRDPLLVPCVSDRYWATFGDVPGVALSRALERIRQHRSTKPLPSIAGLGIEARYALELDFVRRSFEYGRRELDM